MRSLHLLGFLVLLAILSSSMAHHHCEGDCVTDEDCGAGLTCLQVGQEQKCCKMCHEVCTGGATCQFNSGKWGCACLGDGLKNSNGQCVDPTIPDETKRLRRSPPVIQCPMTCCRKCHEGPNGRCPKKGSAIYFGCDITGEFCAYEIDEIDC